MGRNWHLAATLMSRRAVRYIFPAYPLVSLAGAQLMPGRARNWIRTHPLQIELALALFLVLVAAFR